ncbi:SMC-Scp complex subunit ScpB [Candidatus Kaiserbacteria bacterium]|nr:SMC-Scp complex subunit ScpB [Candidatus Kaiserbacteria bacterium]
METSQIATTLEALLFAAGEPLSFAYLSKLSGGTPGDVKVALDVLAQRLTHGLVLVRTNTTAALAVAPGMEDTINQLLGDPEDREIGQAGLEVLSILLYQGPATRSQIDYIRGVNSTSSIRTLLMRGLIERTKGESREGVYHVTTDALTHLGVSSADELPEAASLKESLKTFIERKEEPEQAAV